MLPEKPYRDYADFLASLFVGKVQKLSVNAGFSCPNRDGRLGHGGCIYCNNASFTPAYSLRGDSVSAQIEAGKRFFSRKYPQMKYLAYFQSYTSTNSNPTEVLGLLDEALECSDVVGAAIGTRPDCIDAELLDGIARRNENGKKILMEFGAESSHDETLRLVNRCHTWADTVNAVRMAAARNLHPGIHLILGLPGEKRCDMLETVRRINDLPVSTVKFHQLQVLRGTPLALAMECGEIVVTHPTIKEYVDLCVEIVHTLRPDIAIDRFVSQAPKELLISPIWGVKNHEFTAMLHKALT